MVIAPTVVFQGHGDGTRTYVDVGIVGLVLVLGVIYWLVTRWRIDDGTLRIETGLLRRQSLRFPLTQIQAIDIVRPLLARAFGLAELRLRMGGAGAGAGRLAYLTQAEAEDLRGRLLALAHGIAEDTPVPPAEHLLSVPTGRLIGSIVLSIGGWFAILVAFLVLLAVVAPDAIAGVIGGSVGLIFTLAASTWRRFNGDFHLTVAEAPDGLRLSSGLLETNAETIPRGRVQAVRMSEPLLWRPFGWCRLEVDVAGRQRKQGENRSDSRRLRSVLPVGSAAEARWLLGRILPDTPSERSAPPRRARWKSPLRYHYLSWGHTDTCAVATSGRLRRVTAWVPLAKIQSIRQVQGPLQRRFGLTTVHLDTAGRNVHAALRDRDTAEALLAVENLTVLARAARAAGSRDGIAARPPHAPAPGPLGGAGGPAWLHPSHDDPPAPGVVGSTASSGAGGSGGGGSGGAGGPLRT